MLASEPPARFPRHQAPAASRASLSSETQLTTFQAPRPRPRMRSSFPRQQHLGANGRHSQGTVSRTQRPQHLTNSAVMSSSDTAHLNAPSPKQFNTGPTGAVEDVRSGVNKLDEQSEDSGVVTQPHNVMSPLSFDIQHTFHPSQQRGQPLHTRQPSNFMPARSDVTQTQMEEWQKQLVGKWILVTHDGQYDAWMKLKGVSWANRKCVQSSHMPGWLP